MYDSYLPLPDTLLIWFYQNDLFSLKCFLFLLFLPFLSLSLPLYFSLALFLFSPPSLSPSCVRSFLFTFLFHLPAHVTLLLLLVLSPPLRPSLSVTHPLCLALACASCSFAFPLFLSICYLGNDDSCILVFCIFWIYKRLRWPIETVTKLDINLIWSQKISIICVVMVYRNGNFTNPRSL